MKRDKALIYIRVSTEEQAADGRHSLNTQSRVCERAIEDGKTYQLAPIGTYSDPGKSATNMSRPGLQDMLLRIRDDKSIGAVFVQDTDRLARNAGDHLSIKAIFSKHGVRLISVSQPGIEDSPEGNFMDLVIAGVNQLQSQITGRKTAKSMEERFWSGWWPTKAPMGYLNAADPDNADKRIIIVDPVRGSFITDMFGLYATGNYTLLEIRDVMFKRGLVNMSDKKLTRGQVAAILTNPFYYGQMYWKEKTTTGKHRPLTDQETYRRCNLVKAEHNDFRCRKRKYSFLLRGFIFCACGQRHTAEHKLDKKKSYYRCPKHPDRNKCNERSVGVIDLESQVEQKFAALQFSEQFVEQIITKAKLIYSRQKENQNKDKAALLNRKNALIKKLEIAEEKLLSGIFSDDDFTRVKTKIMPQIVAIEEEIVRLDRAKELKLDTIQKLLNLVRNIGTTYKDAPYELKRTYLSLFWKRFIISEGKIKEAIPTEIVDRLIGLGTVNIEDEKKPPTPIVSPFSNESYYLKQGIRITIFRGA